MFYDFDIWIVLLSGKNTQYQIWSIRWFGGKFAHNWATSYDVMICSMENENSRLNRHVFEKNEASSVLNPKYAPKSNELARSLSLFQSVSLYFSLSLSLCQSLTLSFSLFLSLIQSLSPSFSTSLSPSLSVSLSFSFNLSLPLSLSVSLSLSFSFLLPLPLFQSLSPSLSVSLSFSFSLSLSLPFNLSLSFNLSHFQSLFFFLLSVEKSSRCLQTNSGLPFEALSHW